MDRGLRQSLRIYNRHIGCVGDEEYRCGSNPLCKMSTMTKPVSDDYLTEALAVIGSCRRL